MDVMDKYLYDLEMKLEERRAMLFKEKYSMENAKDLDVLFINTEKLISQYEAIRNKIDSNKNSGVAKGGRSESAIEKGDL